MSDSLATFGPNEWLVDELYEQYLKDKDSVDPAWWDFFADYQPTDYSVLVTQALQTPALAHDAATGEVRPAPSMPEPAPVEVPVAPGSAPSPESRPRKPGPPPPLSTMPNAADLDLPTPAAEPPTTSPGQPPQVPQAPPVPDDQVTVLRGAAARVVSNMDASLTIPVATSVRAIPAKVLIDNRIMLNNHLARARGGRCRSHT